MFTNTPLRTGRPDPVLTGKIAARNLGWRLRKIHGELVKQIAARPGCGLDSPVSVKTVARGIDAAESYLLSLAGLSLVSAS